MSGTVHVVNPQFSSSFRRPDRSAVELLKATEYDPMARSWLVFSSAVPALVEALTAAGYTVEVEGGVR